MIFSKKLLPLYVLLYAGSFHYVYYIYLSDLFNYAYYKYIEREIIDYVSVYLLCLIPLFVRSSKDSIARFSFDLIFMLVYIPSQLMLMFMWRLDIHLYYMTSIALLFAMIFIAIPNALFHAKTDDEFNMPGNFFNNAIYAITIFGVLLLFYSYGSTMRLVGFDQVYDLRSEANIESKGALVDYFVVWLTFISLPFFFAMAITKKSFIFFAIGIFISLALYAAQGAKIAVLNVLIIFSLHILLKFKGDFLVKSLFFSILIFLAIAIILPDQGVWLWAKSIFMVRVYSNAGWMMVTYSEYFYEHGYTFFSHIGIINKILNSYPFGDLTPGQLIGAEYMGTSEANFNANFLASDGIAAVGPLGLPIIGFIFALFLGCYAFFLSKINIGFLILFSSGFIMSLLNAPLSTAILSGGGAIILILIILDSLLSKVKVFNKK